jgi:hypothetical protein
MMKFSLSAAVTVSCYTEVEANSLAEAIEKSKDMSVYLQFNGSGVEATDGWMLEEPDGVPFDISGEVIK